MRWPDDISIRSRILSRSRKQYQNIEIAPRSSAVVPRPTRCELIRFSSMCRTRRYWARRGNLQLEQLLDGADERFGVEVVGEVVHPLHERDHLPVRLLLARLLDPGVDVAHHRVEVPDDLALERDQEPEHAVRGRVVRAHVDREELLLALERRVLDRRGADDLGVGAADRVPAHLLDRARGVREAVLGRGSCRCCHLCPLLLYRVQPGTSSSVLVKITGSPPTGKSRRWGQPT